ncbi:MAG: response regulator transcription factor [bacterium]
MAQFNEKRILIVDDEKDILLLVQKILESAGYDVVTAGDGAEALEKARKVSPDLIVLDLMLPGIDGYQVCGILKYDRMYMKIPILILSARTQIKDYELAMKVGASGYLTKPFEPESLLAKIKELLNSGNPKLVSKNK